MALVVEDIVQRCQAAVAEHTPALAVRDVLDELVADPASLAQAIGPIEEGGITTLHRAPDLTVLHVAWTPGMALNPHDHRMWAAIAMYAGQEDNAFYRRAPAGLDPAPRGHDRRRAPARRRRDPLRRQPPARARAGAPRLRR
jgi:predicted metal-dependent enzyme (double-stranded beta helix superfamily)